eukprot:SAG25_NODE_1597_length_2700_cov_46.128028_2_plen_61_part_00
MEHEAFARTTQAVYYDARALRDVEAALSTLDMPELRLWAEEDGVEAGYRCRLHASLFCYR